MRDITGPFLTFGLYFGSMGDAESMSIVLRTLLRQGGRFEGSAWIAEPAPAAFEAVVGTATAGRRLSEQELFETCDSQKALPLRVFMSNAIGLSGDDVCEVVTFSVLTSTSAASDHHGIEIWTEGWMLEYWAMEEDPERGFAAGRHAWNRFMRLCEESEPAYASILFESSRFLCPHDLRVDYSPGMLRDFFLQKSLLDGQGENAIGTMFPAGTVTRSNGGLFVATSPIFNPNAPEVDSDSISKMEATVARYISCRLGGK